MVSKASGKIGERPPSSVFKDISVQQKIKRETTFKIAKHGPLIEVAVGIDFLGQVV